jgi:hypothetical protein
VKKRRPASFYHIKSIFFVFTISFGVVLLERDLGAQTINFESVPGLPFPIDQMIISNQYEANFGVSFRFEDGSYPQLAKRGAPRTAFKGPNNGDDNANLDQGCGNFFLTDDGLVELAPPPLIITYSAPVSAASGVIIDIDASPSDGGNERWLLEARGINNILLDTNLLRVTSFNTGSGLATPWKFKRATAEIYSIRIIYNGAKTNAIGLAFDNFSPALPIAPAALSVVNTQSATQVGIEGTIGGNYLLQYSTNLSQTNWVLVTNAVLTQAPEWFIDITSSNVPTRFYRALGVP